MASLQSRLSSLITAVGADIKALQAAVLPIKTPVVIPGVAGDGVTDDTAALNAAFNTPNSSWLLEPGKTYVHTGVLTIKATNVTVVGYNATLKATSATTCSLQLYANNATVKGVYHTNSSGNTSRSGNNDQTCPFIVSGVVNATLIDCISENSPASAYFFYNTSNFVSNNCVARYSLADGHHVTGGAHDGVFIDPSAEFVGDDMFANISYTNDSAQVKNIRWIRPHGMNQNGSGRGFTAVGATNVWCDDMDISDTWASGIYIAAESGDFTTRNTSNVFINGGRLVRPARQSSSPGTDAILLYVAASGQSISNISVRNMEIVDGGHIKAGNNNGGAAQNSFSNCRVQAILNGRYDGSYAYADADIGITGANGVTFTITPGSKAGLTTGDPVTAYLTADAAISSTSQSALSGSFNMNYIAPGTYEFEIVGAYSVATSTAGKPVFNFGNNQGSVLGILYEVYTNISVINSLWSTSSNSTVSAGNNVNATSTTYPFRISGVVQFTSSTGNNVWSFQVGSNSTSYTITIKAGTRMVLRQIS